MKIKDVLSETSAGNIATVVGTVGGLIRRGKNGAPEAPQKKNKNGTVANALDQNTNIFGNKKKR